MQTTSNSPTNSCTIADEPYPGLRPYDENEKNNFFGRDRDCRILNDKILANRLTLLFAATGVGKSSLLRAKVIPELKKPLGEHLDVVYYNDWISDPLVTFKQTILASLEHNDKIEANTIDSAILDNDLAEFIEFCSFFSTQPFVLILDQFEEFFRYQVDSPAFMPFIDQLSALILNKSIPISLVIAMREDYALELNAFKPRLPMMLFENYYRLEKLGRQAAEIAIKRPAERYCFTYEPALLQQLLRDLLSYDLEHHHSNIIEKNESVDPPLLQIICSQLWQTNQQDPERTIRLQSYTQAGAVQGLLKSHINQVQRGFSLREKHIASKAFNHLIGHRGTKMAYPTKRLAQIADVKYKELERVLEKLTQLRVLRSQKREQEIWYELYHDVFSESIELWNNAWKQRIAVREGTVRLGFFVLATLFLFGGYDFYINKTSTHLQMNINNPDSIVELYQGKVGSMDFFHQQQFLAQTNVKLKDREPDKRKTPYRVLKASALYTELIGTFPLEQRVLSFAQTGLFEQALNAANDLSLDSNVQRSEVILENLSQIFTQQATNKLLQTLVNSQSEPLLKQIKVGYALDALAYAMVQKELDTLIKGNDEQRALLATRLGEIIITPAYLLLLKQLSNDPDEQVKLSAITALGKTDLPASFDILQTALTNKNAASVIRKHAAIALGNLGNKQAIPLLIDQLDDNDEDVKSSSATALGMFDDTRAIPMLIELLADNDSTVKDNAVNALSNLSDKGNKTVIAALTPLLDDNHKKKVRRSAAYALGRLGNKTVIPNLIQLFKDNALGRPSNTAYAFIRLMDKENEPELITLLNNSDADIRASLAEAIGRLGKQEYAQLLIPLLKNDSAPKVRLKVAQALGELGDNSVVTELIQQLDDQSVDVQQQIIIALGKLNDTRIIPQLTKRLKDHHSEQSSIIRALGDLGDKTQAPLLIQQIKDSDTDIRNDIAGTLGKLGDEQAIPMLIQQLKDSNNKDQNLIRRSVAEALGRLGAKSAIPELLSLLKDNNTQIQSSVAEALGLLKAKEAVPALIQLLNNDHLIVRENAVKALGNIADKEAVPSLIKQLNDMPTDLDKDTDVQGNTVVALSNISGKNVTPLFIQLLKSKQIKVQLKAIEALGSIDTNETVSTLIPLLKHNETKIQKEVIQALGNSKNPLAIQALTDEYLSKQSLRWVKITAACALLTNKPIGLQYLNTQLQNANNTVNIDSDYDYDYERPAYQNTQRFIIDTLGYFPSAQGKKILLTLFDHALLNKKILTTKSQIALINALKNTHATQALPTLYHLRNTNNQLINKDIEQAIAHLESDKNKLITFIKNSSYTFPTRLQALNTLATIHKQAAIPYMLTLLEEDEATYGATIWQLFDTMQAETIDPRIEQLLEDKLKTISKTYEEWRQIRDTTKPESAFQYAHTLARINPERGKELLNQQIFTARQGAWRGLATLGDVKLVKELTKQRFNSQDKPLLHHALFRAIDLSLINIQVNAKQADLASLSAWLPTLKEAEKAEKDGENAISQRVDWTIAQLKYHLEIAMPELERRYDVWLEKKQSTRLAESLL